MTRDGASGLSSSLLSTKLTPPDLPSEGAIATTIDCPRKDRGR
jgi:hypothetical protein